MGLADALREAVALRPGTRCRICRLLEVLEPADREALATYLADRNVTHRMIERALRSEGYSISDDAIGAHRRGECS